MLLGRHSCGLMLRELLAEGKNAGLVVLGEKGKAQLQRDRRDKIATTVTELGKYKMTFAQVSPAAGNTFRERAGQLQIKQVLDLPMPSMWSCVSLFGASLCGWCRPREWRRSS